MKTVLVASVALALASLLSSTGCGSADDPTTGSSAQDLSGSSANGKPTASNDKPSASTGGTPSASTGGTPSASNGGAPSTSNGTPSASNGEPSTSAAACPAGERFCALDQPDGTCREVCVPAGVICADHTCPKPICDPVGPRPRPVCSWDVSACEWTCPVCDPAGPKPLPGCQWDAKACVWLCL